MTTATADIYTKVYYRDGALRLNLPPRSEFCKAKCSPLFLQLITSARLMLGHEQARIQKGSERDGEILIQQLAGRLIHLHFNWSS